MREYSEHLDVDGKMARKQRFDWIKFHKLIHKADGVDPQGARVVLEERQVGYDFFVKAVNPDTGLTLHPTHEDAPYNATMGFVTAVGAFCPDLEIRVGDGSPVSPTLRKLEIRTTYQPKTSEEIGKILAYLRTVPVDGNDMKEDDTFFCYD